MDRPNDLPTPTRKTPLPRRTISAATAALLIPLVAVAALLVATRSSETQDVLTTEQKLRELRATEERQLTTYDWIDRPASVVRIPVSRARELMIKEAAVPPGAKKP